MTTPTDIERPDWLIDPVLVLRTCNADLSSKHDPKFVWGGVGSIITAEDYTPEASCGHGLHGLPFGEGRGSYLSFASDAKWLVVEVPKAELLAFEGKVKFRRCLVVHVGDKKSATDYIAERAPGKIIVGAFVTAGDWGTATAGFRGTATAGFRGTATAGVRGTATAGVRGTATAGDSGTATAGDSGTATAGYGGTATAGDYGTATVGDCGTATAGDCGTATAGDWGTATAGVCGTATAGDYGTATAGDRGTATAGYGGTATAGDYGTATVGDRGTATAGYAGTIVLSVWRDGRKFLVVGYVGLNGILPNVKYRVAADDKSLEPVPR